MKNRPLLAFYGDDFTGSTDVMEALYQYGLRTILFLSPPNEKMLSKFGDIQCIGVAGTARAKSIDEIKEEIIPVFEKFKEINPYYVHYKICSTFDSSPTTGSIGYAADIARDYFKGGVYPLLAAAPALGRYTAFSNHFANFQGEIYRLDDHPVMSQHPVTPMKEANLVKHLSEQTNQHIESHTIEAQNSDYNFSLSDKEGVLVFDAIEEKNMKYFGKQLWDNIDDDAKFVIGSSGVEYALGDLWKNNKLIDQYCNKLGPKKIDKILVVSGSISDVTRTQLEEAEEAGFYTEQVPHQYFGDGDLPKKYLNEVVELLNTKKKVIIYTARGPADENIGLMRNYFNEIGVKDDYGNYIGKQLGKWTKYIIDNAEVKRLVVSGGDTSGFVSSQLGIYAMEVIESVAPGAPLCTAYSEDDKYNNLEISLKSGQLGGENFYQNVFELGG